MNASQRRSGGCCSSLSALNSVRVKAERNARLAASERFLEDERKEAGKPTYFTAVVVFM